MSVVLVSSVEEPMPDPDCHFRVVYIAWKDKNRIVSMTHQSGPKAHSMVSMLNRYAQFGHFRVEDEHDDGEKQAA